MKRVVAVALFIVIAVACSKKAEPPKAAAVAPAAPQPTTPPAAGTLSGKVLETMDSGGYTYLKLRTGSGDVWAAVQQTKSQSRRHGHHRPADGSRQLRVEDAPA